MRLMLPACLGCCAASSSPTATGRRAIRSPAPEVWWLRLLAWLLSLSLGAFAARADVPPSHLQTLSRGANFTTAFERPLAQLLTDLTVVRRAGFWHIRMFVDADWVLAGANWPASPRMGRLDAVVDAAVGAGLGVILCMTSERNPWTDGTADRAQQVWGAAWRALAVRYARVPSDKLFFELANEPKLTDGARWSDAQDSLRRIVRKAAPNRTLLLTGSPLSMVSSLAPLRPGDDPAVVYTFHEYQPMAFTHQGADWLDPPNYAKLAGLVYPPSPANLVSFRSSVDAAILEDYARTGATVMAAEIDQGAAWAREHHAHIVVTEFGVYRKAPVDSRAAWLGEAQTRFTAASFGWTIWEFDGGFGIKPELMKGCVLLIHSLGLC